MNCKVQSEVSPANGQVRINRSGAHPDARPGRTVIEQLPSQAEDDEDMNASDGQSFVERFHAVAPAAAARAIKSVRSRLRIHPPARKITPSKISPMDRPSLSSTLEK